MRDCACEVLMFVVGVIFVFLVLQYDTIPYIIFTCAQKFLFQIIISSVEN